MPAKRFTKAWIFHQGIFAQGEEERHDLKESCKGKKDYLKDTFKTYFW